MNDEQRVQICEVMKSFGIDPSEVPQRSVGAYGYEVFSSNNSEGRLKTDFREWPEGAWEEVQKVLNPIKVEFPLTLEKLEAAGRPVIISPAPGILAIVADYSNDTIDMTYKQARELHSRLGEILEGVS